MSAIKNIEFKARCGDHSPLAAWLEKANARYVGEDHQIDTYFNVPAGRLKLRQGNIEQTLIFYKRPNLAGPKQADVQLYHVPTESSDALRTLLETALGVMVVVDKRRHIYFIDNVKIHLDTVKGLGTFLEVEAIDKTGDLDVAVLHDQCNALMQAFGVAGRDLVTHSYSDMLREKRTNGASG